MQETYGKLLLLKVKGGFIMANHGKEEEKPVYKKVWFWILIVLFIIILSTVVGGNKENVPTNAPTNDSTNTNMVKKEEEKITLEKFNKIETGMTYEQVVEIIGEEGTVLSESNVLNDEKYHTIMYSWKAKNQIANANVTFQGGKVISKAQMGLN